jgi:hypothetical protein
MVVVAVVVVAAAGDKVEVDLAAEAQEVEGPVGVVGRAAPTFRYPWLQLFMLPSMNVYIGRIKKIPQTPV